MDCYVFEASGKCFISARVRLLSSYFIISYSWNGTTAVVLVFWTMSRCPFNLYICFYYRTEYLFRLLIIPHATSCGGYNVFDPSVSQSVSPVFLVSATPLKPHNRISWNFVAMKDIMCRYAYPQEILIPFFFSELRPFWT